MTNVKIKIVFCPIYDKKFILYGHGDIDTHCLHPCMVMGIYYIDSLFTSYLNTQRYFTT